MMSSSRRRAGMIGSGLDKTVAMIQVRNTILSGPKRLYLIDLFNSQLR
jgi:hypothetical protein